MKELIELVQLVQDCKSELEALQKDTDVKRCFYHNEVCEAYASGRSLALTEAIIKLGIILAKSEYLQMLLAGVDGTRVISDEDGYYLVDGDYNVIRKIGD